MVRKMIIPGYENSFDRTRQIEHFCICIPRGYRFRNSDYVVSLMSQDITKSKAHAFIKNDLHATASFSVARNAAYSRQALISSTVKRGKFLRIVS